MKRNPRHIKNTPAQYLPAIGVFLFIIDRLLKHIIYTNQEVTWYFITPWIGWEYFANPGIAFSLPLPNDLVVFITPVVLLFLFLHYLQQKKTPLLSGAIFFILVGALSNYIDRFLFEITIDYLRLGNSVINIADIMIVTGAILLFFSQTPHKKKW